MPIQRRCKAGGRVVVNRFGRWMPPVSDSAEKVATIKPKSLATLLRNRWKLWSETSGNFGPKSAFETQEPLVQADLLFVMANIDLSSKHTLDILQKARLLQGDDRVHTLMRNLARDLDEYRRTGDPKLLEPYNVSLP